MFDQIVATLDGSEYAERALRYAEGLAHLSGGELAVVCVLERDSGGAAWQRYVEGHVAALLDAGLPAVTAVVRRGDAASVIVEVARERAADVIVMSTHGLGGNRGQPLGSVALDVLRGAPCPVLMIRIEEPEPARTPAEERWQEEGGAHVS